MNKERLQLTVNGQPVNLSVTKEERLIDILRHDLGLKGTRFGCGEEMCGACTVLIDGKPVFSCTFPAGQAAGRKVMTIEGIGTPAAPHALQRAFIELQAGQCGYCLPGIIVSAAALLKQNARPTREDITVALDRHLCRCGAHNRIIDAVQVAARSIRAET